MNYWINPNTREKRDCLKDSSGDYVSENGGRYTLCLIVRYSHEYGTTYSYMPQESIEITFTQFSLLKGFVPIKRKKLFGRRRKIYAPTVSDGVKGKSERMVLPSKAESRDEILKRLGL